MNQDISNEKWNRVLDEVSKSINPNYFQSFITPLQFIKLENDSILLSAP